MTGSDLSIRNEATDRYRDIAFHRARLDSERGGNELFHTECWITKCSSTLLNLADLQCRG